MLLIDFFFLPKKKKIIDFFLYIDKKISVKNKNDKFVKKLTTSNEINRQDT